MYQVNWSRLARLTYYDEQDFILIKWNQDEVNKFEILVDSWIETVRKTTTIGVFNVLQNHFSIVISKQTSLFYKINEDEKQIELSLFWNNSQNPSQLDKLITLT